MLNQSGIQTKNNTDEKKELLLDEGIHLFNEGKYFEAHECFEVVWKSSIEPEKSYLKAIIQVCGFFHLLKQSKFDPALRLAHRALEHFSSAEAHFQLHGLQPQLRIVGVEEILLRISAYLKVGMNDLLFFEQLIKNLKAKKD